MSRYMADHRYIRYIQISTSSTPPPLRSRFPSIFSQQTTHHNNSHTGVIKSIEFAGVQRFSRSAAMRYTPRCRCRGFARRAKIEASKKEQQAIAIFRLHFTRAELRPGFQRPRRDTATSRLAVSADDVHGSRPDGMINQLFKASSRSPRGLTDV